MTDTRIETSNKSFTLQFTRYVLQPVLHNKTIEQIFNICVLFTTDMTCSPLVPGNRCGSINKEIYFLFNRFSFYLNVNSNTDSRVTNSVMFTD